MGWGDRGMGWEPSVGLDGARWSKVQGPRSRVQGNCMKGGARWSGDDVDDLLAVQLSQLFWQPPYLSIVAGEATPHVAAHLAHLLAALRLRACKGDITHWRGPHAVDSDRRERATSPHRSCGTAAATVPQLAVATLAERIQTPTPTQGERVSSAACNGSHPTLPLVFPRSRNLHRRWLHACSSNTPTPPS